MMTDDAIEGLTITVAEGTLGLSLVYPDGSRVQLTMPKPSGIDGQSREQAEAVVRRMGSRLLAVAREDLKTHR
jgi:hypothetical protein